MSSICSLTETETNCFWLKLLRLGVSVRLCNRGFMGWAGSNMKKWVFTFSRNPLFRFGHQVWLMTRRRPNARSQENIPTLTCRRSSSRQVKQGVCFMTQTARERFLKIIHMNKCLDVTPYFVHELFLTIYNCENSVVQINKCQWCIVRWPRRVNTNTKARQECKRLHTHKYKSHKMTLEPQQK